MFNLSQMIRCNFSFDVPLRLHLHNIRQMEAVTNEELTMNENRPVDQTACS